MGHLMRVFLPAVVIVTLLGSCSSDGGIGGTGISVGAITGFGSIFVNGVEFNTDDAVITVDGALAAENDLGIGMVVVIEGTFDANGLTGSANRITYEELVEGPIDVINIDTDFLIVMGQIILINKLTVFDGADFESLAVGNILEVSGWTTSSGAMHATRVELKAAGFIPDVTELEITGIVENLDQWGMTFTIGNLVIDYANAVLTALPGSQLSNGLLVEVESPVEVFDGVLTASRVKARESILANSGGLRLEIQGVVTDFTSSSVFEVNGIPVRTDLNTMYENGSTGDIALNVELEVEGTLGADSVLQADEIDFELPGIIEIEAGVQDVVPQDNRLILMGITVTMDNLTVVWDNSDSQLQPFGLGDILIGDRVAVIGDPQGSTVLAVRIERRNPAPGVEIEGPVTAVADPTIEIFGVTLETGSGTLFLDMNEVPISSTEFFLGVQIDTIVEVEGTLMGGNIIDATIVEFAD